MYHYRILLSVEITELVVGVIVSLIVVMIAIGMLVMLISLSRRKTQLFAQEKENLQLQFNEQLLRAQVEIQEHTLQHIGRELHDNFGQVASLIKINLYNVRSQSPESALANLDEAETLTRQLLTDIKSLAGSLNSDNLVRLGLTEAIQREIARLNRMGKIAASFEQEKDLPDLPADKLVLLFRMVQEIINNMIKYSSASQFSISATVDASCLLITFRDNGVGFDVKAAIRNGGSGLGNLYKRADLLGAILHIDSEPGKGVYTEIKLPV